MDENGDELWQYELADTMEVCGVFQNDLDQLVICGVCWDNFDGHFCSVVLNTQGELMSSYVASSGQNTLIDPFYLIDHRKYMSKGDRHLAIVPGLGQNYLHYAEFNQSGQIDSVGVFATLSCLMLPGPITDIKVINDRYLASGYPYLGGGANAVFGGVLNTEIYSYCGELGGVSPVFNSVPSSSIPIVFNEGNQISNPENFPDKVFSFEYDTNLEKYIILKSGVLGSRIFYLDSISQPNNKSRFHGYIFVDLNWNDEFDIEDYLLPTEALVSVEDSLFSFTNDLAAFRFLVAEIDPDLSYTVDAGPNYTMSPTFNYEMGCYQGFQRIPVRQLIDGYDVLINAATYSPPRPGFDLSYQLLARNQGTLEGSSVKLAFSYDDLRLDYLGASQLPNEIIGDSLVWHLGNLASGEFSAIDLDFNMINNTDWLGDTLVAKSYVIYDEISQDVQTWNNTSISQEIIVGSYDPNDKNAFPGEGPFGLVDLDTDSLEYVIRFQNTGTFAASFIEIVDTIDTEQLDLSQFKMRNASHEYNLSIEGNILKWFFLDIDLPPNRKIIWVVRDLLNSK